MEKNYLDRDLDSYLSDNYLDLDPEDATVYMGHSLLNTKNSVKILFIVQSLFDGEEIAIHPIFGLKLSRS